MRTIVAAGVLSLLASAEPDGGGPGPTSRVRCAVRQGANAGRRPVLVFSELNPWRQVIDSDVPSLVAYEDGEVLVAKKTLRRGRLTPERLKQLLASVHLERLRELPERTETFRATDQATTVITWREGASMRSVAVYGPVSRTAKEERFGRSTVRIDAAPEAFVSAVEVLRAFEPDSASDWTPEVVELMVGSFDHSRREPVPWPPGWPGWDSPEARRPSTIDGNPYLPVTGLIFIDGGCWKEAIEFKRRLDPYTAVLLEGRKYSLDLRPLLPGESDWKRTWPSAH